VSNPAASGQDAAQGTSGRGAGALFKSFVTVGTNTLLSRVLGFAREMLIAAALGAGPVADAFYAAFRFPNLFRRLFAEGAFNSAFIPLFARALEEGGEAQARSFAQEVLSALFVILLALTGLVLVFTPLFVAVLVAPGFVGDPEKFDLTVVLTRIMFPYLAFMSLVAMLSGVLNAFRRYFAAAFAPVLLNVILVAALAFALHRGLAPADVGLLLGWGVLASGVAQLALLALAVRRAGFGVRLSRPRLTRGVRRLLWLAAPAALAGGVTQVNLFIGQIIASAKPGAIAILQYADRIYQLPLGVVGIAIGVVLLPELSRSLKAGHMREAGHQQNRSLEFSLFLTLPAAISLFILAEPIVRVLFERGAFSPVTTEIVAAALAIFALGLPAFVLVKVFSPGFFAREDTKTPMIAAGIGALVNIGLSVILFPLYAEVGIALATTLSGWINAALLGAILVRRRHWPVETATLTRLGLVIAATLALGAGLWIARVSLDGVFVPAAALAPQAAALLAFVAGGALFYIVLALGIGAVDRQMLAGILRRPRAR
jgi:putative peptidoglycan lipid II flippase